VIYLLPAIASPATSEAAPLAVRSEPESKAKEKVPEIGAVQQPNGDALKAAEPKETKKKEKKEKKEKKGKKEKDDKERKDREQSAK
jgi:hypothetical protein